MEDFIFVALITLTFTLSFSTFGALLEHEPFQNTLPKFHHPEIVCHPSSHDDLPQPIQAPGDVYFRGICETGSDAPSITLKLKSIACLSWISLSAAAHRCQRYPKIQP